MTRNQRIAFPNLERSGGTVVNIRGNSNFPNGTLVRGTQIPPQRVTIIHPSDIVDIRTASFDPSIIPSTSIISDIFSRTILRDETHLSPILDTEE